MIDLTDTCLVAFQNCLQCYLPGILCKVSVRDVHDKFLIITIRDSVVSELFLSIYYKLEATFSERHRLCLVVIGGSQVDLMIVCYDDVNFRII